MGVVSGVELFLWMWVGRRWSRFYGWGWLHGWGRSIDLFSVITATYFYCIVLPLISSVFFLNSNVILNFPSGIKSVE